MSITKETLQAHLKDPAIFCCRREKGLVISEADLEDPGLFDDMIESGLLELNDDALTIEQVIGCTLMKDCEALVPITAAVLDRVNEVEGAAPSKKDEAPEAKAPAAKPAPVYTKTTGGNGMIHIEIDKADNLEGLRLDIPVFAGGAAPAAEVAPAAEAPAASEAAATAEEAPPAPLPGDTDA